MQKSENDNLYTKFLNSGKDNLPIKSSQPKQKATEVLALLI